MTTVDQPGMVVLFPGPLRNVDYFALPESNLHIELFDGRVLMAPAPTPMHQRVVVKLAGVLDEYSSRHGGAVFVAPLDVELADGQVFQPDVLYLAPEQAPPDEDHLRGAPALVVEVLSPGTRSYDIREKAPVYARAGVLEMWAVDPRERSVSVYRNRDGVFGEPETVAFGTAISSQVVDIGDAELGEL